METRDLYGDVWNAMGLCGDYLSMETICVWNCCMDGYVFVWNLYGSVCMDISGSISRV